MPKSLQTLAICALILFSAVSAQAAHGPGRDPRSPRPDSAPPFPPGSPQNNICGGGDCFPPATGPGPQNGSPFVDYRTTSQTGFMSPH